MELVEIGDSRCGECEDLFNIFWAGEIRYVDIGIGGGNEVVVSNCDVGVCDWGAAEVEEDDFGFGGVGVGEDFVTDETEFVEFGIAGSKEEDCSHRVVLFLNVAVTVQRRNCLLRASAAGLRIPSFILSSCFRHFTRSPIRTTR